MVAVIDYGVGNLFSLLSSLKAIGAEAVITNDVETIRNADRIILPGVGAFEDAAKKLFESGLHNVIIEEAEKGKPLMGICLGMQLLFERSFEYGEHKGLGLIKGDILGFDGKIDKTLKIPQIGWNALKLTKKDCPLWKYIKEGDYVYFVHSYFAEISDATASSSDYGIEFTAAVSDGNIYGCQFHPEKSGDVGLNILRGFCEA
ncbi:MAG: imidazole glycerol phosphate synthase subunit HisH [Clostridia bacterium]|nr:imidazole glycerol phosphate synthase subunit HisH [Clostridia bacterium]MBQ1996755.1 imidazole glycerol phosphate synthase subunit HisH [Clostridia bacterium]MBQ5905926.1 imidazole glycerol phosphate synthase subunit HisH [Clostridia bacterium]